MLPNFRITLYGGGLLFQNIPKPKNHPSRLRPPSFSHNMGYATFFVTFVMQGHNDSHVIVIQSAGSLPLDIPHRPNENLNMSKLHTHSYFAGWWEMQLKFWRWNIGVSNMNQMDRTNGNKQILKRAYFALGKIRYMYYNGPISNEQSLTY